MDRVLQKIISLVDTIKIPSWIDYSIDLAISIQLLNKSLEAIQSHPFFSDVQKQVLQNILQTLFNRALPYFKKGLKFGCIYHNIQVCFLIIQLGIREQLNYNVFKNAMILGLLHDIGNANASGQKYSRAMIKEELQKNNISTAIEFAKATIKFRLEHMQKAEPLIREVTQPLIQDNFLKAEDLDLIVNTIKIHDYPSIEGTVKELKALNLPIEYQSGQFLFSLEDSPLAKLTSLIREADTLFTLTPEGILTDLMREKKPISEQTVQKKLEDNIQKFYDEYGLYRSKNWDDGGFINQTLFRTKSGYQLFKETAPAADILSEIQHHFRYNLIHSDKLEYLHNELKSSFYISRENLQDLIDRFKIEIRNGLAGHSPYLKMLPTYLESSQIVVSNQSIQNCFAIDLGGSTLRILKVNFLPPRATPQISFVKKFVLDRQVKAIKSSHALFDLFAKQIKTALIEAGASLNDPIKLGLTFSFPFTQLSAQKSKMIEWSKGFSAKDAIGEDPIELFETAFKENGLSNLSIQTIINDSTATLLSGSQDQFCDMGLIIGTSTNIAFQIPTQFIQKPINHYSKDNMIVVLESNSRFSYPNNPFFTRFDNEIDDLINTNGSQRIGKLFTGNYMGNLLTVLLKHAAVLPDKNHPLHTNNGFLAKLLTEILEMPDENILYQLNQLFTQYKLNITVETTEDAQKIKSICDLIIQRAAKIATAFIISTIQFMDPKMERFHSIAVDGSVFNNNAIFRDYMMKTLELFQVKNIAFKQINDGSGIGAAMASFIRN